jgi:hypothetical protein
MAIHYAHLAMLAAQGIVSAADAHRIREALDAVSLDEVRRARQRRQLRGSVLLRRTTDHRIVRRGRRRPSPHGAFP